MVLQSDYLVMHCKLLTNIDPTRLVNSKKKKKKGQKMTDDQLSIGSEINAMRYQLNEVFHQQLSKVDSH